MKDHICQFNMIECFVCDEECLRRDILQHNNKKCFLKDDMNRFSFPNKKGFFLVLDILIIFDNRLEEYVRIRKGFCTT